MNPREKILAISAFSATGILLVVFVLSKLILGPTAEFRQQAVEVAGKVDKLEMKNRMEALYKDSLNDSAKRSYGDDASTASEMSRAHIVKLIAKAGLAGDDLSMTPVTGKNVKGGREVGWTIRVKGSLDKLTNFLYVVNADPHLHKLDGVSWTPIAGSTDLTLQARFATLVLDPVDPANPVVVNPESLVSNVNVNSPERRWYGLISDRDIFRPYIKRPPERVVVAPPPRPGPNAPSNPTPPPTPTSTFQLVGLPTWNNDAEVVVKDTRLLKSTTYKIGEALIGGQIVMVDYRPLPLPKKPLIISTSRVIVRVGKDYWAVELGQYLTDKYVLTGDRLPDSLRSSPGSPGSPGSPSAGGASGTQAAKPFTSDSHDAAAIPGTGSEPVSKEAGHVP